MSHRLQTNRGLVLAWIALAGATMGGRPVSAQTYVSAEPIPSQDIVGSANLAKILNLGYPNLELWSQRLLNDCHMVESVITALSNNAAISTVNTANSRNIVAAGGFQAVTDPSFMLTI